MSIAELRGKLSPESVHDRQEDLLTSDVFGTMYYAGWQHGFLNWILSARPALSGFSHLSNVLGLDDVSRLQTVHYAFWPTLPNNREPDVALAFELVDGTFAILVIETKYFSGLSNYSVAEDAMTTDCTGHQLVDQLIGMTSGKRLLCSWFSIDSAVTAVSVAHVLITADLQLPREIYEDALQRFSRRGSTELPCPAYWLSWRTLAMHLRSTAADAGTCCGRLVRDLIGLLERKELTNDPFEGFKQLPWPLEVGRAEFWKPVKWFKLARRSGKYLRTGEVPFWKKHR